MKLLPLFGIVTLVASTMTSAQAQTEQDMVRFERHVATHDLAPQGGSCVVSFTLTNAGYIATMNLGKCAAREQSSALTRLAAALPFPASTTVSRDITIRL